MLTRLKYRGLAVAYAALSLYVLVVRREPRQAVGWFAVALAYGALAKDGNS